MCFNQWLAVQSDRDDPTGDLAKLCAGKQFPTRTLEQFAAWVGKQNSIGVVPGVSMNSENENRAGAIRTAEYAWCEYHFGAIKTERAWRKLCRNRAREVRKNIYDDDKQPTADEKRWIRDLAIKRAEPGELLAMLAPQKPTAKNLLMSWLRALASWNRPNRATTQRGNAPAHIIAIQIERAGNNAEPS